MPKKSGKTRKVIGNFEYEVSYTKPDEVVWLPASRKDRIDMLKEYIYNNLEPKWKTLPKAKSTLHREFVSKLINSIY